MPRLSHIVPLAAALLVAGVASAQKTSDTSETGGGMSADKKQALIKSALAAAPKHVAEHAAVIAAGAGGQMVELRSGTNGFTCIPDAPDTPGKDPMCLDEQGMVWAKAYMSHAERPANTAPGIGYMLQGGSDISATDPWAKTTSHYVASPPHWMLLWPVDAEKSGFPTTPKKTGTWIMWSGTPYAHLMINQVP